jgi:CheY-like chemotaxis protein
MTSDQAKSEASDHGNPAAAEDGPPVAQVVIADDDPEALDLLDEVLRSLAVDVHRAVSGAELVVLLADHGPFDLVVTDIDMPWMEGLGVIRSVRAADIQTPVLFVSGIERPDLAASVARLGNARLLRKPIAVSALRSAVNEMLVAWETRRLSRRSGSAGNDERPFRVPM